jgi:hypothetical protein
MHKQVWYENLKGRKSLGKRWQHQDNIKMNFGEI